MKTDDNLVLGCLNEEKKWREIITQHSFLYTSVVILVCSHQFVFRDFILIVINRNFLFTSHSRGAGLGGALS